MVIITFKKIHNRKLWSSPNSENNYYTELHMVHKGSVLIFASDKDTLSAQEQRKCVELVRKNNNSY